jgi:hypothetical protein
MSVIEASEQANIFCRYLLKTSASETIQKRYAQVVIGRKVTDRKDQRALSIAFAHPALLPLLDSGLKVLRPHAELRFRASVVFALLETDPDYYKYFSIDKLPTLYIFVAAVSAVIGFARTAIGILFVKCLGIT